jgi:hypothetical protein
MACGHARRRQTIEVDAFIHSGIERHELVSKLRPEELDRPFVRRAGQARARRFETLSVQGRAGDKDELKALLECSSNDIGMTKIVFPA